MISFQQLRQLFLKISLVCLLSIITTFGFINESSLASPLLISSINPLSNQIAWGNKKVKEEDKNIEDKTESQIEESEKFNAQTKDGISNAIQNPDYQPSGKTKQAEKEDRQGTKDIKAEANDAMLSN